MYTVPEKWTDEEIELLKANWGVINSAHMVTLFPRRRTSNSLVGKARKIGLPILGCRYKFPGKPITTIEMIRASIKTESKTVPLPTRMLSTVVTLPKVFGGPPIVIGKAHPIADMLVIGRKSDPNVTIDRLAAHHCRYPLGKNQQGVHTYCGIETYKGSWCKDHYHEVFDLEKTARRFA